MVSTIVSKKIPRFDPLSLLKIFNHSIYFHSMKILNLKSKIKLIVDCARYKIVACELPVKSTVVFS